MRAFLALLFTLTVASAAPILTVTVSPALQSGVPGQTLVFPGTLENLTTGTVFINSNSLTFDIAGIGVLDDSFFLLNAPISLNSLEATKPFDFFSVSIPALQTPGLYSGVFTVLGGADGSAADVLGTGTFQVQVNSANAEIPEPSTVLLLGGGLALLLWQRRR